MLKLGIHWGEGGNNLDECLQAHSASVKLCDAFPKVNVPADTLIIGRVVKESGFTPFVGHPRQAATDYIRSSLHDAIVSNPHVQAWEALNEPVWGWDDADSASRMLWYSEFLAQCAREIVVRGKKAIIGNWSTGCPPVYDLWYAAKSMLEVAKDFPEQVFVGVHVYGPLWRKGEKGQLEPDTDQVFRYRKVHEIFSEMGYPETKIAITECGLDSAGNETIGYTRPWRGQKSANDYWSKIGINYNYGSFNDYWRYWIEPFEREIRKDKYILCANLFSLGLSGWGDFQLPGLELAHRMQALSNELGDIEEDYNMTTPAEKIILDVASDLKEHSQVGTYTRYNPDQLTPSPWPAPHFQVRVKVDEIIPIHAMPDLGGMQMQTRSRGAVMDVYEITPQGNLRVTKATPYLYAPGKRELYDIITA